MIPTILLKLLPYLAAIGLAFGGYFYVHHDGFVEGQHATQAKWDKAKAEAVSAELAKNKANQTRIYNLEVTRNENLNYINKLDADNRALVKRLRLPRSPCPSVLPPTPTPGGSQDTTPASGVVHTDVSASPEEALNEFDATYRAEAYRCDKLVEDVRVVLLWATSLKMEWAESL